MISLLEKHSCQVPTDHNTKSLNPIILLPAASSGISYEALHYPISMEQYQLIPLVINTGKIPLINHAEHYFIPNSENQQTSSHDQQSNSHDKNRSITQQLSPITNSNTRHIGNQPTYNYYPPTSMYSETRVEHQPSSLYSYGYKIIGGNVDNLNTQHQLKDNLSGNYNFEEGDKTKTIFETNSNDQEAKFNLVIKKQKLVDQYDQKKELNMFEASKPIVMPDLKTEKTKFKKRYNNKRNLKTLSQNGNYTALNV